MKIKRFNEKLESGHATWGYILNSCDNIIGITKEEIENYLKHLGKNIDDDFIFDQRDIIEFNSGYFIQPFWGNLILIFKNSNEIPSSIIYTYELINPFSTGNVIIMPGHDYVRSYDTSTGEHKKQHIR